MAYGEGALSTGLHYEVKVRREQRHDDLVRGRARAGAGVRGRARAGAGVRGRARAGVGARLRLRPGLRGAKGGLGQVRVA